MSFPPSAGGAVGNSRRQSGQSSLVLDDSGWLTRAAERKGKHEDDSKDHQHFGGVKNLYASIENPPYMRLVIEDIGVGPRGRQAISVAHYFPQNGDLCQDPELCFELVPQGGHVAYEPFLFQQAIPPICQEVFENDPASENHRLKRKLTEFAQMWDRNLQEQGFITAAAQQQTRIQEAKA